MAENTQITIEEREDGPLVVKNVPRLERQDGTALEIKPVMALCRCGKSQDKPFCDGSHNDTGFSSKPADVSGRDRVYSYAGKDTTVYYNKLLCSHAGECGKRLKAVFDPSRQPWVDPDAASAEAIEAVVAACPSGALRLSRKGGEAQQIEPRDCRIVIEENGPYRVSNVDLVGGRTFEGSTKHKYVLCRCGLSANKPYCDGTHADRNWRENGA